MKNILIFNDISGLGNCSLAANLPVFSKLGHYCMPVVTAAFSCQTGFENFTCQRNENVKKSALDILQNRQADAIYAAFCADANILQQVVETVQKSGVPFVFVDPVLGDNGSLYSIFDVDYLQKMKQLVSQAHCISPNLTEACLLADVDFSTLATHRNEPTFLAHCGNVFSDFLQIVGAQRAVITGVECGRLIGNIVLEKGLPARFVTNERVDTNFSGTGDLFSSVLLGELLNGQDLLASTQIAANFVAKAAAATASADRRFGVDFCRTLNLL